jgi:hypothetical protein
MSFSTMAPRGGFSSDAAVTHAQFLRMIRSHIVDTRYEVSLQSSLSVEAHVSCT